MMLVSTVHLWTEVPIHRAMGTYGRAAVWANNHEWHESISSSMLCPSVIKIPAGRLGAEHARGEYA